jgi:hypothetical protein
MAALPRTIARPEVETLWASLRFGTLTAVPFNAANFTATAGGGTWTVTAPQVFAYGYVINGHLCWISLFISGSTVTGTVTQMQVTLPVTALQEQAMGAWATLPAGWGIAYAFVTNGTNSLLITPTPAGPGTLSTGGAFSLYTTFMMAV